MKKEQTFEERILGNEKVLEKLTGGGVISSEKAIEIARMLKESMGSLVTFRKNILENDITQELAPAEFHYRWSDILLGAKDNFCIQGYRESAKTNYILRAFPLYRIFMPSDNQRYILLIKRNQDIASAKLKDITREMNANRYLNRMILEKIEESATSLQLKIRKPDNPTDYIEMRIEAYGKQSSIRGASWGSLRPQIILIDDIQDKDDMDSEKILRRDWEWFLDDILYLAKNSRIFMISNNLGEKCVSERIMRAEGHFGFICEKMRRTSDLTTEGIPAWPAKDTQSKILEERDRYIKEHAESIWMRNNMCECIGEQDRIFYRENFQYYPISQTNTIAASCNVYIRIDPAVKKGEENDPSAFVVGGINKDNHMFVLDAVNAHLNQHEKENEVFRLVRKWRPINVGIENSKEGQILIQQLLHRMPQENCFFRVIECSHGGKNKAQRIETALATRFATNTVWFPDSAPWLHELENQLLMFSKLGSTVLHDDLVDSLAYLTFDTNAPVSGVSANYSSQIRKQQQYERDRVEWIVY